MQHWREYLTEDKFEYIRLAVSISIIFLIGWISSAQYYYPMHSYDKIKETPASRIGLENVYYNDNTVCFNITNPLMTTYMDTGSMLPTIGYGMLGIEENFTGQNLKRGDIIAYEKHNSLISHRIINIDTDELTGDTYYTTKGDNNDIADDYKVYEYEIKRVLVAIIY